MLKVVQKLKGSQINLAAYCVHSHRNSTEIVIIYLLIKATIKHVKQLTNCVEPDSNVQ